MFKKITYAIFASLLILTIGNLITAGDFCNINELQKTQHGCCTMNHPGDESQSDCDHCLITQKEIISIDNNKIFSQSSDISEVKSEIAPDAIEISRPAIIEPRFFNNNRDRDLLAYYHSYLI